MKAAVLCVVACVVLGVADARLRDSEAPALRHDIIHQVNTNPDSTWRAGVNSRFVDATVQDARRLMGVKQEKNGGRKLPVQHITSESLPVAFDAREAWGAMCPSVYEVRDQSACGSCWAQGAVEAQTDRICIQSNGTQQVHLSAEDMTACCTSCGMGCNGGYPSAAWQYWVKTGVVDGGNYTSTPDGSCAQYSMPPCGHHTTGGQYPPCSGSYSTPKCPTKCANGASFSASKHKGKSAYSVSSNANAIATEIMTNGPVEVAFSVYEDFLTYKSGVYKRQSGSYLGGHAVKMLGWGVWTDAKQTPYWICANSWNEDWGDGGYFLIARGSGECGIESGVVAGMAF